MRYWQRAGTTSLAAILILAQSRFGLFHFGAALGHFGAALVHFGAALVQGRPRHGLGTFQLMQMNIFTEPEADRSTVRNVPVKLLLLSTRTSRP